MATAELGDTIDMKKVAGLPNVIYEPEQFPGAIYYAGELEGVSILIFANGKIVIGGLRNRYLVGVAKTVISQLIHLLSG